MATYGIGLSIDVTAIDKSRLVKHKNGKTYLNMTAFVDVDNKDQYENNGMITHSKRQDEAKDAKTPILGNASVFWTDGAQPQQQYQQAPQQQAQQEDFDEDIPF